MASIDLYTVGYTRKPAEQFFDVLKRARVQRVIDVRLNRTSQLAGFAKARDLAYFLQTICGAEYRAVPQFAPTREMLNAYRATGDWNTYETEFQALIAQRQIETVVNPVDLHRACLLCAEASPEKCHRRLVAEYLKERYPEIAIHHL